MEHKSTIAENKDESGYEADDEGGNGENVWEDWSICSNQTGKEFLYLDSLLILPFNKQWHSQRSCWSC